MTAQEAHAFLAEVNLRSDAYSVLAVICGTLMAMTVMPDHEASVIWLANHVKSVLQREGRSNGDAVQASDTV